MGFPVGCAEVFFPYLFLHLFSLLGLIRTLILALFRFLGLSELLEPDVVWPEILTRIPESPPVSALLIREFLPVFKFSELMAVAGAGDPPGSCAVCLFEFEGGEEIRWLKNCRHVFHRNCLDRWMDHDQRTCPLCRTPFVRHQMEEEFDRRLRDASETEFHFSSEYSSL